MIRLTDTVVVEVREDYLGYDQTVTNLLDSLVEQDIIGLEDDPTRMSIYVEPYKQWGTRLIVGKKYDDAEMTFFSITFPKPVDKATSGKVLVGWGDTPQINFEGMELLHTNALQQLGGGVTKLPNSIRIPDYGGARKLVAHIVDSAREVLDKLGDTYGHLLPQLLLVAYSGIRVKNEQGWFEHISITGNKQVSECLKYLITGTAPNRIIYYWKKGIPFEAYKSSVNVLNDFPIEWLDEFYE